MQSAEDAVPTEATLGDCYYHMSDVVQRECHLRSYPQICQIECAQLRRGPIVVLSCASYAKSTRHLTE